MADDLHDLRDIQRETQLTKLPEEVREITRPADEDLRVVFTSSRLLAWFMQMMGVIDHGGICLFELSKFAVEQVQTEEQRWLKFFNEGEHLEESQLPEWMQTNEMRQAKGTPKELSEKERAYHAYQSRQNDLRQQRSIERHIEALMAEAEQARKAQERAQLEAEHERAAKNHERTEKEAALAEIKRLKRLLKAGPPIWSPSNALQIGEHHRDLGLRGGDRQLADGGRAGPDRGRHRVPLRQAGGDRRR